jgi:hypothetical protein
MGEGADSIQSHLPFDAPVDVIDARKHVRTAAKPSSQAKVKVAADR